MNGMSGSKQVGGDLGGDFFPEMSRKFHFRTFERLLKLPKNPSNPRVGV